MFRSNEVIAIVDLFNLDGRMVQIHPVWDHRIDRHAAFGHNASAIVSFPAATRFARFSSSRSKNFELYGLYQVKNSLSGSSKNTTTSMGTTRSSSRIYSPAYRKSGVYMLTNRSR